MTEIKYPGNEKANHLTKENKNNNEPIKKQKNINRPIMKHIKYKLTNHSTVLQHNQNTILSHFLTILQKTS